MRDFVLAGALVVAFATLVAAHVATVFGLFRARAGGRALLAAVVPPLAPYWAARRGLTARAVIWLFAGVAYVVALVLALRQG